MTAPSSEGAYKPSSVEEGVKGNAFDGRRVSKRKISPSVTKVTAPSSEGAIFYFSILNSNQIAALVQREGDHLWWRD